MIRSFYLRRAILFLAFLPGAGALQAQLAADVEFGRVTDEDRLLMSAPGDSTAEAYVLFDRQHLSFEYSEGDGAILVERRHRRVKLLRPASFSRANVKLEYDRRYSTISNVEALLHLPGGGSVPVTEDEFLRQETDKTERSIQWTFPRVEEGAIIEYRYVRRREGILLPTPYVFQENIPVRWAQYDAVIPPYYGYARLGNARLDVDTMEVVTEWGPTFGAYGYAGRKEIEQAKFCWAMQDIPAFRSQPYANNAHDYLPQVKLQLQEVQYPGRPLQKIYDSWEETAKSLHERQDFGRFYTKKSNYGKAWREFSDQLPAGATEAEIITAAYEFVNRRVTWDGNHHIVASQSPNRVLDDGRGRSADLNMLLLALLNEAGIEAHPLLVSLRNTGKPVELYPMLDQFSHLMVYLPGREGLQLLDAGDPARPAGLPQKSALNHRGWVVDPNDPRWIDLDAPPSRRVVMVQMEVGEDATAQVNVTSRLEHYFALEGRNVVSNAQELSDNPLVRDIYAAQPETSVTAFETKDMRADRPQALDMTAKLSLPVGQAVGDYLYLQPIILPALDGELADSGHRYLPVDFPYTWSQRYLATIHLPAGYALEEMPESRRVKSEDGSIEASIAVEDTAPGVLSLNLTVHLRRSLFPSEEYAVLRDIFQRIIDFQQTTLVCKRTTP